MRIVVVLLCLFAVIGCGRVKNYKEAYRLVVNGQPYVKLCGERRYMAHDLISLFNGTYKDSVVLPLPSKSDGVLEGKDIPINPGYYNFKGTIILKGHDLVIDLLIDNTDDKTLKTSGWNGTYTMR